MPKINAEPPKQPHANANKWNRYFLKGTQLSTEGAVACCKTVSCPRCRAAKGWPCTTVNFNPTPTPHAARWEKYREYKDSAG